MKKTLIKIGGGFQAHSLKLVAAIVAIATLSTNSAQAAAGADMVTALGGLTTDLGLVVPVAIGVAVVVIGAVVVIRGARRMLS